MRVVVWSMGCGTLLGCGASEWPSEWRAFEDEVLVHTNEARATATSCGGVDVRGGAGPLEMDTVLRDVARGHSEDMALRDFFAHDNPDGDDVGDRLEVALFGGAYPWGENLALGTLTPSTVVDGWMSSPGHCQNIMNPDYEVIGIGYFPDGSISLWTQVFAGSH
ncbi:MAG: CAP domain-containing protein [Myxococcales bacterium]|nr:CAP domain-containing protein [Myxococcales bacterium]